MTGRVPVRGEIILFSDAMCRGKHWHVFDSCSSLEPDDVVSSFVIIGGQWQFFADPHWQGQLGPGQGATLGAGVYNSVTDALGPGSNDKISSLMSLHF